MYHAAVPDPVFGVDCALGARSWTVADGKVVEEGSLTDGKDYTDAGTVCRLDKGREFRFKVKPGRYQLRFGVSPFHNVSIVLKGAAGGDGVLPAAQGESTVEAAFEATGSVLSLSTDEYALFRWLTVIERVPGDDDHSGGGGD
ncbi:MAG TPA: hypothetical protein PKY77_18135 [Phycisphaerae bacterium]|nr:hypothetical protein [Phycisphaerae bacterium]HRY70191.1 hypothetical protein [Phycisphaerae bacterium]